MPYFNPVKVKAGFDQTLADADSIEAWTPTGGNPQRFKAGRGGMVYFAIMERVYREGEARLDLSVSETFAGLQQVTYNQPGCHPDAYAWLVTNYRGNVTCSFPRAGTTYETFNARLRFEKSPSQIMAGWYAVDWIFSIIEVIV